MSIEAESLIDHNESHPKCCICFNAFVQLNSPLLRCIECKIFVHENCYGAGISQDKRGWRCERCTFMHQSSSKDKILPPYCSICPVEGGALRQSIHHGIWCHVVCMDWIPEITRTHSGCNGKIDLSPLEPSRESLRCLLCGQRGGCIQCLSKRCARSFHVICAMRCPSNMIYTGYDSHKRQAYHCHMHLSDIIEQSGRIDIVDLSWKNDPKLVTYMRKQSRQSIGNAGKRCQICKAKIGNSAEKHQIKCMLSWLTAMEVGYRKKKMEVLGHHAARIPYRSVAGNIVKGIGDSSNGATIPTVERGSDVEAHPGQIKPDKRKRVNATRRPCPECGELVKEMLMIGHLRKRCVQRKESVRNRNSRTQCMSTKKKNATRKNGELLKAMKRGGNWELSMPDPATNCMSEDGPITNQKGEISDVLFSSWPGQFTGDPMDTTYFWSLLQTQYHSNRIRCIEGMNHICEAACGASLEALCRERDYEIVSACVDRALIVRECLSPDHFSIATDNSSRSCLYLGKMTHTCAPILRKSKHLCPEDSESEAIITIVPCSENCSSPSIQESMQTSNDEDATSIDSCRDDESSADAVKSDFIRTSVFIRLQNSEDTAVACTLHMLLVNDDALLEDASFGFPSSDPIVWCAYSENLGCDIVGTELQSELDFFGKSVYTSLQIENEYSPVAVSASEKSQGVNELTPEINFLIQNYSEQTQRNRQDLRFLCMQLSIAQESEPRSLRAFELTEAYYQEFMRWRTIATSLTNGFPRGIVDGKDCDSSHREHLDDGTCVICFDGSSPEHNPIIFCDRCDLAVHQLCYGVAKVPPNEFFCDRCIAHEVNRVPASTIFCQLCPLQDGAFKQTMDGKWIHVVCAFWCPGVWIGNIATMEKINLTFPASKPRFVDTMSEIESQYQQLQKKSAEATAAVKANEQSCVLNQGSLCAVCLVSCGRTIQCCNEYCTTSFHPLCAWYDGVHMTVDITQAGSIYAGGGAGLQFTLHCKEHAHTTDAARAKQRYRRRRLRIDMYYRTQSKKSRYRQVAKPLQSSLDESSYKCNDIILEDTEFCSACFQYASPPPSTECIVGSMRGKHSLFRCQCCNTFIHPTCSIKELNNVSDFIQIHWTCEKCTFQSATPSDPSCILCAQHVDYMLPCMNMDSAARLRDKSVAQTENREQRIKSMSLAKNTKIRSETTKQKDEWVHRFCSRWYKLKFFRRNQVLHAIKPETFDEALTRCDICAIKGRQLARCELCAKHFHPICAARENYYIAQSAKNGRKIYCLAHASRAAAFDYKRQTWITQEHFDQLYQLRYALERGRMLMEMVRHREKSKRRLFLNSLCPLLRQSLGIVMINKPSLIVKDAYNVLTGECLKDLPKIERRKSFPLFKVGSPAKRKSSRHTATSSRKSQQRKRSLPSEPDQSDSRSQKRDREILDKSYDTRQRKRSNTDRYSDTSHDSSTKRKRAQQQQDPAIIFQMMGNEHMDFDELIPLTYPKLI